MRRPPVIQAAAVALLTLLIPAAGHLFLINAVSRRIHAIDSEASWSGIRFGNDAVLLVDASLPGTGLSADSLWVIVEGVPFHAKPVMAVGAGGSLYSGQYRDEELSVSDGGGAELVLSLMDVSLADGTLLTGSRICGEYTCFLDGSWGSADLSMVSGGFTGVFQSVSGIPFTGDELPGPLAGHTVSGRCTGTEGNIWNVAGLITEIDGRPAQALFTAEADRGGLQSASLSMDFSQVSEPAMALLDSLTGGAVITAAPAGSLSVFLSGADSLFFTGALEFQELSVYREEIAPDTITTEAFLFCSGGVLPESCQLFVDTGMVRLNSAEVYFTLDVSWETRRMMRLFLYNHSLTGGEITSSVPDELMGSLNGLSLGGELDFAAELLLDWDYPDSSNFSIDIDSRGLRVNWSPVSFSRLREEDGGASCTMRDTWGNTRTISLDTLHNSGFVVFDSIPAHFEPLLCCAEDASFRRHSGFSEYHIRNSIRADMTEGRFVRGGSTLSMQLAKNLFLGREKTLARKLQEVFLTWRMERWLSKDRILEIYANIVELGPDVFGFDQAALYYFDRRFADLSVRETAYLVSILPGPKLYHRFAEAGALPGYWQSYVDRLISICGRRGWLDDDLVASALADTIVFRGARFIGGVDN
ncbi:hypothetical protein CSA37_04555 [Candidatus Fermentibacteria bacterium]|nr:MAG: hypothetical protein CSA37_06905 [Candidatus Fermentibacteria bacterium]PIE52919.1 MAG: hypothetical protein CSA37_04555 [Candidatus Fermentibacteria bacterium]